MERDKLIDVLREAIIAGVEARASKGRVLTLDSRRIDLDVVADRLQAAIAAEYERGYDDGVAEMNRQAEDRR